MITCYKCQKKLYRPWIYCPHCGTLLRVHSKIVKYKILSDDKQIDRIEQKLDILIKRLK